MGDWGVVPMWRNKNKLRTFLIKTAILEASHPMRKTPVTVQSTHFALNYSLLTLKPSFFNLQPTSRKSKSDFDTEEAPLVFTFLLEPPSCWFQAKVHAMHTIILFSCYWNTIRRIIIHMGSEHKIEKGFSFCISLNVWPNWICLWAFSDWLKQNVSQ